MIDVWHLKGCWNCSEIVAIKWKYQMKSEVELRNESNYFINNGPASFISNQKQSFQSQINIQELILVCM